MKNQLYLFIVLCTFGLVLTNCRKKTGPDDHTVVPPPEPVLLLDSLIEYESEGNGVITAYHTVFKYDADGRLLASTKDGVKLYEITYNGGEVSSMRKYDILGNIFFDVKTPGDLTINEDSISYQYPAYLVGIPSDNVRSFLFDGELLKEERTYRNTPEPVLNFAKRRIYDYTPEGDLKSFRYEHSNGDIHGFTVTAVDDKINVWRNIPLDLVLAEEYYLVCGTSAHNVTEILYDDNTRLTLKWTYNEAGYPLSLTFGDADHPTYKFIYREK